MNTNTTTYTVAEAGAKSLKDMKYMTFGLNRFVTANVTGDKVSVFVGMTLHYDGQMPEGMVQGSAEFYQWVRDTATAGEKQMEELYDAGKDAQAAYHARGCRLAGTPLFVMDRQEKTYRSNQAKAFALLDALNPTQMLGFGSYRRYRIEDAAWAYATRNR